MIVWPDDLFEIIYVDNFGNAMTGIEASTLSHGTILGSESFEVRLALTFADIAVGKGFWYENANNLVELAVNQGSAEEKYNLLVGQKVKII